MVTSETSILLEEKWMDTLQELFFNISRACAISFVSGFSSDDERRKSICHSVAVTKIHLFSDNKIIWKLPALLLFQYTQIQLQKLLYCGIRVSQDATVKITGNH